MTQDCQSFRLLFASPLSFTKRKGHVLKTPSFLISSHNRSFLPSNITPKMASEPYLTQQKCFVLVVINYPSIARGAGIIRAVYHSRRNAVYELGNLRSKDFRE
jgi:hypothetical protein